MFADDGFCRSVATFPGPGHALVFLFNHLITTIMAVVQSLAIGKSVKSAGNLTYRVVRGRTIASQRITSNTSNSAAQQTQRSALSLASKFLLVALPWVTAGFEKSKYGSPRNNFMKLNNFLNGYPSEYEGYLSGTTSALDYVAEGFTPGMKVVNGVITIKKAFNYVTKGSASAVVTKGAKATISGHAQAEVYDSIEMAFPTPVLLSSLKVSVYVASAEDKLSLLSVDMEQLDAGTIEGIDLSRSTTVEGAIDKISFGSGIVGGLRVSGDSILIPIVTVDGKIVTSQYALFDEDTAGGGV